MRILDMVEDISLGHSEKTLEVYNMLNNIPKDPETQYIFDCLLNGQTITQAMAQLDILQEEKRFKEFLIDIMRDPKIKEALKR